MRQLEMMLGEDGFRDGLREYLRAHALRERDVGRSDPRPRCAHAEDLETWSRTWIEEAGRPVITTDLRVENGRIARLAFVQTRSGAAARAGVDRADTGGARIRRRDPADPGQPECGSCRRAGSARPAGAALRAADRRRPRLWRVRPRSGDPRLPADAICRTFPTRSRAAAPSSRSGKTCWTAGHGRRTSSTSSSAACRASATS